MIEIAPTEDKKTCYALRHAVFVVEQGYTAEGEVDALDESSHHILAREDGTPIATAPVYLDGDTAKIGRVCVISERRGGGIGADLIAAAVRLAQQKDAARAVLGAQARATGFYSKLGFTPYGTLYDDEGEPHQMMELLL